MRQADHSLTGEGSGGQPKRPKWHYLYFVLAAFQMLTVGAALYVTHSIMDLYTGSVESARVWAERAVAYGHLEALAAAVNAPGNDVFQSLDVEAETARLQAASHAFELEHARLRTELKNALDPAQAKPLIAQLDAIGKAMDKMKAEAKLIFSHFRAGRPESAGEHMAAMDRRHGDLNAALRDLRNAAETGQLQHFEAQRAAAGRWQRSELGMSFLVFLFVAGATYYGLRVARQVQRDFAEEQRRLAELGEAQQALQETNHRLQGLFGRALEAQEAQRQHIARELHEEVAQMLGGLRMRLDALRAAPRIPQQVDPHVEAAGSIAENAIHRLQDLVRDLTPHGLEDVGLGGVLPVKLAEWTKGSRLAVHFSEHLADTRLPLRVATAAYRVAEEAVANVLLHADAHNLQVELTRTKTQLRVRVADDGVGFDPVSVRRDAGSEAMGISVMEQRTALLGGSLVIVSQPAGGTTVTAVLPVHEEA